MLLLCNKSLLVVPLQILLVISLGTGIYPSQSNSSMPPDTTTKTIKNIKILAKLQQGLSKHEHRQLRHLQKQLNIEQHPENKQQESPPPPPEDLYLLVV